MSFHFFQRRISDVLELLEQEEIGDEQIGSAFESLKLHFLDFKKIENREEQAFGKLVASAGSYRDSFHNALGLLDTYIKNKNRLGKEGKESIITSVKYHLREAMEKGKEVVRNAEEVVRLTKREEMETI